MTEVSITWKPAYDLQSKSMGWFLYDRDLRHEGVIANYFVKYQCFK